MRLAVNADGDRVDDPAIVHDVMAVPGPVHVSRRDATPLYATCGRPLVPAAARSGRLAAVACVAARALPDKSAQLETALEVIVTPESASIQLASPDAARGVHAGRNQVGPEEASTAPSETHRTQASSPAEPTAALPT